MPKLTYQRHVQLLLGLFAAVWIALAVKPWFRADWLLENLLLIPTAFVLFWGYRHRLFSRLSFTLMFVFLCLHEIGAHHTYSKVPYDAWWQALTGGAFNDLFGWKRNHFDRLVHFLYGLLLAYPIREVFLRVVRVRGFWGYFLPLDLTLSSSAFFELVEWIVALVVGGDAGNAYLGTQGDVWDAQKDMALAAVGAFIAMTITAVVNKRCQRDFAREWADSFTIKRAPAATKPGKLAKIFHRRKGEPSD